MVPIVTTIHPYLAPLILLVAADVVGPGLGASEAGITVMKSFWGPTSQCLATPQIYHFLPGVARFITS